MYVTDLTGNASITVRKPAPNALAAERVASDLRLAIHGRLRAVGAIT